MVRSWIGSLVLATVVAVHGGSTAQPLSVGVGEPFSACVAALRQDLDQHREVRRETFDTYTGGAQDLRPLIDGASRAQPEFELPIRDYLARRADAERAAEGRALMQREAD